MAAPTAELDDARRSVAANRLWYHTMELAPGVVTPGWFDLRSIVDKLPWPDVQGLRCLDVGPYDGFFSFELERRGAAEVVAADIAGPSEWDWPVRLRARGTRTLEEMAGEHTGGGFAIARELLGSNVERIECSVYDLSPERVGKFDLVVCGSLLLHLRNPIAALEAIHSVCSAHFLSAEQIDLWLTLIRRRSPAAWQRGGERGQWWVPNLAAHRRMVEAAGFAIERTIRPYAIPFGPAHPTAARRMAARDAFEQMLIRALAHNRGLLHSALLARPA